MRRERSEVELIDYTQGKKPEKIMDGVDTSWDRVKPNDALRAYVKQVKDSLYKLSI